MRLKLDHLLPVRGSLPVFQWQMSWGGVVEAAPLTPSPPLGLSQSLGCSSQMLTPHFSLPN